jgi:hypothetical protein
MAKKKIMYDPNNFSIDDLFSFIEKKKKKLNKKKGDKKDIKIEKPEESLTDIYNKETEKNEKLVINV